MSTQTPINTGELAGKHIVLGLSGGIAAYKAAELCRAMVKEGASVQVVMTEAAEHFMTKVTMQALSGRQVFGSQWDDTAVSVNGEGIANNMPHINLTRGADAIVIAPCSADFMAKLLHGRADELLSLMCLARPIAEVPLILAPAMNREMWANPATQRNVAQLKQDGNTADLIFPIPKVLSYISSFLTLEPGDLVLTGTPDGVGPMRSGDRLEVTVEGIGTLKCLVETSARLVP